MLSAEEQRHRAPGSQRRDLGRGLPGCQGRHPVAPFPRGNAIDSRHAGERVVKRGIVAHCREHIASAAGGRARTFVHRAAIHQVQVFEPHGLEGPGGGTDVTGVRGSHQENMDIGERHDPRPRSRIGQ